MHTALTLTLEIHELQDAGCIGGTGFAASALKPVHSCGTHYNVMDKQPTYTQNASDWAQDDIMSVVALSCSWPPLLQVQRALRLRV